MPGDDLYWSPVEVETDESIQEKEPYIDPWDLENYAYIREHLDYMELSSNPSVPSGSSGDFAEANSHSFQYVPGYPQSSDYQKSSRPPYLPTRRSRKEHDSLMSEYENYAAIDEIGIYDRKARSDMYMPMSRRRIMDEYESDSEEVSPYAEGNVRGNSVFGIYDENGIFRRVALPVSTSRTTRDRSLSFSYGDYEYDPYSTRKEIYSNLNEDIERKDSTLHTNDDVRRKRSKPDNFGLSKNGHLKIDYSYSWNNLNKYIKYN